MEYIVTKGFFHDNKKYERNTKVSFNTVLSNELVKKGLIAKKEVKAIKPEPKKKRGRPSKKNK